MNRYIILIGDNENLWEKDFFDHGFTASFYGNATPGLFQILQSQQSNVYLLILHIQQKVTEPQCLKANWIQWNPTLLLNSHTALKVLPSNASSLIFSLTDLLPYPGSYFLSVYWSCSDFSQECFKHYTPLLGVCKKLKLWNQAEVKLIVETLSPSIELLANFLSAEIQQTADSYTLFCQEKGMCIWKGSLNVENPDTNASKLFSNFRMLRHSCQESSKNFLNHNKYSLSNNSFVWFGNSMKAIDLIDVTTVPLLLLSGCTFILQCNYDNAFGIDLQKTLSCYKNAGMLFRLPCICSDEEFPPCKEVSSEKWKEVVVKTPSQLHCPNIALSQKPKNLHFLVTVISKETCGAKNNSSEYLTFHAHALHLLDQLDVNLYFEKEFSSAYNLDSTPSVEQLHYSFSDATKLQFEDKKFGQFFDFILKNWEKEKSEKVTPAILQNLILESCIVFKTIFQNNAIETSSDCTPLLESLGDEPKMNFRHIKREIPEICTLKKRLQNNGVQTAEDKKPESPWLCNDSIKTKVANSSITTDILSCFETLKSKNVVDTLRSLSVKEGSKPSGSQLTDFASAIATSYHGICFNVDAQGSEKRDRQCRRMVEKLVKFETLSVGSVAQVPSPLTPGCIDDSPFKALGKRHTPRKRKKLAKVAEKLYEKRNSLSTTARLSKSSSMVFKTPTKKGKIDNSDSLLFSPSVHKMSLRSSTPTKDSSTQSALSKTNLLYQSKTAKSTTKKQSQKLHVRDNKKRLQKIVVDALAKNNVDKSHVKFDQYVKKLYRVSMAYLKDLKTSKDLENIMKRIVKENVATVLSFEIQTG